MAESQRDLRGRALFLGNILGFLVNFGEKKDFFLCSSVYNWIDVKRKKSGFAFLEQRRTT